MNERIFSNPNIISSNYKQGIILVEGSSALIFGNKIDRNIKANIALGGRSSGLT
jgi:parallel beta-helix repeat protein